MERIVIQKETLSVYPNYRKMKPFVNVGKEVMQEEKHANESKIWEKKFSKPMSGERVWVVPMLCKKRVF